MIFRVHHFIHPLCEKIDILIVELFHRRQYFDCNFTTTKYFIFMIQERISLNNNWKNSHPWLDRHVEGSLFKRQKLFLVTSRTFSENYHVPLKNIFGQFMSDKLIKTTRFSFFQAFALFVDNFSGRIRLRFMYENAIT